MTLLPHATSPHAYEHERDKKKVIKPGKNDQTARPSIWVADMGHPHPFFNKLSEGRYQFHRSSKQGTVQVTW